VRRFVARLRAQKAPEAHVVIHTEAGQEGHVDYGEGPMVRQPETGTYRRTRLLVFTLGHSRKSIRLISFKSSSRIWAELHERAFRRLGGAPRVVVLDNLREGVIKPDFYDPTLNPLYADVLRHYGVVGLPCRVRDPDRKGKVGSPASDTRSERRCAGCASRQSPRHRRTSIAGDQLGTRASTARPSARSPRCTRRSGRRCYRCRSSLSATTQYGDRTVHLDGHLEINGAYYCAPPGTSGACCPSNGTSNTCA
jgi:hypothetical protein